MPRPFRGRFIFPMQEWSVLHLFTKFEADCLIHSEIIKGPEIRKLGHVTHTKFEAESFHSKVIRGSQNFEIGSNEPGHAQLRVVFIFHTQAGSVLHLCIKSE